jgi:hypothetical protein
MSVSRREMRWLDAQKNGAAGSGESLARGGTALGLACMSTCWANQPGSTN